MLESIVRTSIDHRRYVIALVACLTALMITFAVQLKVGTQFEDLLPVRHSYVSVHQEFKSTFGSSNSVTVVMELDRGHPEPDIFHADFLRRLQVFTFELRKVEGVNDAQIVSLAARKLKDVEATSDSIEFRSLMFPNVPATDSGLDELRSRVIGNEMIYGTYVSADLRAALISVDFYDHLLDADKVFVQMRALAEQVAADGITIRMIGEPILVGWVSHYLPETLSIAAATLAVLALVLWLLTRSWRGTLLPGLSGFISGTWALGLAALLGIQFDPLVIVVAFLITARAISHSVQIVTRFDQEVFAGEQSPAAAAKAAMHSLFKPGMLGLATDAGCILVVALMPIPVMQKLAFIGAIWVATITVSAIVMTPVMLSWVRLPLRHAHAVDVWPALEHGLRGTARLVTGRGRLVVAAGALLLLLAAAVNALDLTIGDANPGSPVLHPSSEYNTDAAAIGERFPGAGRMFVVLSGDEPDAIKRPESLHSMRALQRYMEVQPAIGASLSLADVVPTVKRVLRDGNHRYEELGGTQLENGELLYFLASGGADQSDMDRFSDPHYMHGSVTLFFRDRQGETVRAAIDALGTFIEQNPVEGLEWRLAGGVIGMVAAINEVILGHQLESIALALLVVMICCIVTFRSMNAGVFFMAPVILANVVTFSFMAWKGIGMNINTLPVAALGIGLGIDYAFYIVDGIRSEIRRGCNLVEAVERALLGPGKGVLVTAAGLIFAVVLWTFSSVRFQGEMALLMAIWLFVSAVSALVLMPALVVIFRPAFVVGIQEPLAEQDTEAVGSELRRAA